MSFWKRRRVTDFFRSSVGTPVFRRTSTRALKAAGGDADQAVAVWASRMPAGLVEAAARQKIALIRVEDGFIRSVGLGSDFVPAASLVLDRSGMHYDPGVRSDLELLLLEAEFDAALIARASTLIDRLVARGITKYNLRVSGSPVEFPAFEFPPGRRRILVPGQGGKPTSRRQPDTPTNLWDHPLSKPSLGQWAGEWACLMSRARARAFSNSGRTLIRIR